MEGRGKDINSEEGITTEKSVIEIARKHNCTPAQVLLAWGMQRNTAVIPKSVNPVRLSENYESVNINLEADDIKAIGKLERNHRLAKGLYCVFPDGYYTLENIWET